MSKPIRFAVIPPEGPPEEKHEELTYDRLVALVGYPVGVIHLPGGRATLYVSDEGKAQQMPRNERATALVQHALREGDYVVGTGVLVGPATFGGTDTSIPGDVLSEVMAWAPATESPTK